MAQSVSKVMHATRGFYFPKGGPFGKDIRLAKRIYESLRDNPTPDSATTEDVKRRASQKIQTLFELCHENVASHNNPNELTTTFWDEVRRSWKASNWGPSIDLQGFEVKKLVTAFVVARQEYVGMASTSVTALVDRWIESSNERQLRRTRDGNRRRPKDEPDVKPPPESWPPSYFFPQEKEWLLDTRVRGDLEAFGHGTVPPTQVAPFIPKQGTPPIDVQKFLTLAALTQFSPEKHWTLAMRPVAFIDNKQRQNWRRASVGYGNVYWTINDHFIPYVRKVLSAGNRDAIFALFTYWSDPDTLDQVESQRLRDQGTDPITGNLREKSEFLRIDPKSYFLFKWRPKSVALVLVRNPGRDEVKLILYNPPDAINQAKDPLQGDRPADVAKPEDLVRELKNHFKITAEYSLKKTLPYKSIQQPTSTTHACGFLWDLATVVTNPIKYFDKYT
ncbi:hypothetical protein F5Y16DRAFT_424549 [Xylariaceae sp. FL0255]|nr:hypothetical protein F5Y16DRAFT_424549 [Xylariaceae sp. FL0255]